MHVQVNGTRLWFDVEGPGLVPDGDAMRERPTVVLLHGGPGSFDHSYLKPDFSRLAGVAQVIYLDVRDHGRSEWGDPAQWSPETCGDDVRAFCDALGIAKPVVYGHSLGGFLALHYATRHPGHAGGLLLDSTFARFDARRLVENIRRLGGDALADVAERVYFGTGPVTREEWAPVWKLFGKNVITMQERARTVVNVPLNERAVPLMRTFDVVDKLGRVECPTLILVGERDPGTPVAAAREIFDGLRPEIRRLEVIEGAGHFLWRDAARAYWPIVEGFVRQVEAETVA
ncbi:MAG TPA: alpha/beta hydrolase [Candidatus Eisenbacteria bacterium]|jgi:proline iminopeptidase|nr:alpha/beta hydrolase [Candidatus Eisenbacteria bacterium]